MFRRILIYHEQLTEELATVFSAMSDAFHIERIDEDVLTINDTDYYNEEPLDIEELYFLLVSDFDAPFTMIVEPYSNQDFPLTKDLKAFIKHLPKKIHYLDDVIVHAVLEKDAQLKKAFIDYIASCVNAEVIHTVREFIQNNMNSSVSAKKLYMHRNTLNYRIENFIEATHINVKTFKGANAIYMLYQF